MKKLITITIAVLVCLAAVPAFADVSNEIIVGLEGDSTSKVESNVITDPESKVDTKNSLFSVQYTHFFTPLKDDEKPIDLTSVLPASVNPVGWLSVHRGEEQGLHGLSFVI